MVPMCTRRLMEEYCRITGKYAMYISFCWLDADPELAVPVEELEKAAPYLATQDENEDGMMEILGDEQGVLIFDTEEEMDHYYNLTVGDDGPTSLNPYDGKARVYALTCGPEGTRNENT